MWDEVERERSRMLRQRDEHRIQAGQLAEQRAREKQRIRQFVAEMAARLPTTGLYFDRAKILEIRRGRWPGHRWTQRRRRYTFHHVADGWIWRDWEEDGRSGVFLAADGSAYDTGWTSPLGGRGNRYGGPWRPFEDTDEAVDLPPPGSLIVMGGGIPAPAHVEISLEQLVQFAASRDLDGR